MIEEFKGCIHSDVRTYTDEQKVETLDDAARLADDYSLTHKISFADRPHQSFSCSRQNGLRSCGPSRNLGKQDSKKQNFHDETHSSPKFVPPAQKSKLEVTYRPFNSVVCNYCKKGGHLLLDCFKLKRNQQAQNEAKPTGFITSKQTILQSCDSLGDTIRILRDTGASQSLLLAETAIF